MRARQVIRFIIGEHSDQPEARLRYQFYSVIVALAIPIMLTFGGLALWRHQIVLGGLVLASVTGIVVAWLRLRFGRDDYWAYRVNASFFALLALLIIRGGDDGSMSLWAYAYPLIVVFLFGDREGGVWTAGFFLVTCAVLWLPWPFLVYPYSGAFQARLLVMYVVIAVITLGFEYPRRRYHDALLREHQLLRVEIGERERAEREKAALIDELTDTLAQVKTLTGLVPICSHCHRIRDDQGFWNQLETYLREHSHAKFSHGICPGCMSAHYPEFSNRTEPGAERVES